MRTSRFSKRQSRSNRSRIIARSARHHSTSSNSMKNAQVKKFARQEVSVSREIQLSTNTAVLTKANACFTSRSQHRCLSHTKLCSKPLSGSRRELQTGFQSEIETSHSGSLMHFGISTERSGSSRSNAMKIKMQIARRMRLRTSLVVVGKAVTLSHSSGLTTRSVRCTKRRLVGIRSATTRRRKLI